MSKPPVHVIRFGYIKACIWQSNSSGGSRYSVTLSRLFKNGDQWKESQRFGRDDLMLVAKRLTRLIPGCATRRHRKIDRKSLFLLPM